jgi:hypothetical protein
MQPENVVVAPLVEPRPRPWHDIKRHHQFLDVRSQRHAVAKTFTLIAAGCWDEGTRVMKQDVADTFFRLSCRSRRPERSLICKLATPLLAPFKRFHSATQDSRPGRERWKKKAATPSRSENRTDRRRQPVYQVTVPETVPYPEAPRCPEAPRWPCRTFWGAVGRSTASGRPPL